MSDDEAVAKSRYYEDAKRGNREVGEVGHKFDPLSGRVIEAAIAVHRQLGPGFLESVYENALKVALGNRGIAFESQKEVVVYFDGKQVGVHRLDLVVEGTIVVELKAVKSLEDLHRAQTLSYLRATGLHIGLLLNFNAPKLDIERIVSNYRPADEGPCF